MEPNETNDTNRGNSNRYRSIEVDAEALDRWARTGNATESAEEELD